ncbi:hypothetical protein QWZ10_06205 [Paracoccus cavernae]|uniref:Oligopeptide/dipeptide ABC transporter C-terminal domain-containing protein n=1 Tax=Paracoccus cavernae TaxID=1571207 RepID=A0ABT8D4V1_9RHOB|nr:hypothetical protein [Paracoccus cavernae]
MAVILITHDMGVVAEMADRVIVMRGGKVVEEQPTIDLFDAPREDYTRDLLAAVPRLGAGAARPAFTGSTVLVDYKDVSVTFRSRRGFSGGRSRMSMRSKRSRCRFFRAKLCRS